MKLISLLVAVFLLVGCGMTPNQPNTPLLRLVSRDATVLIIGHQKPANQKAIAQAVYDVAGAIADAAADNPDLTSIRAVVRPKLTKALAKLAPKDALIVSLVMNDALDVADDAFLQAIQAGTSTDKGKLAQALVQSLTAGVQGGARFVLDGSSSPVTQPQ